MANKTINVQYKLRGDTLSALTAKNAVYGVNEPIIVMIPADADAGTQAAVLLKMGDGTTAFSDLPYLTAIAGDVPDWAKADTKPEYTAAEIKNLDSYISGKVQDTDTQYKLEQDATDGHILKLYSKTLAETDWSIVATITTVDTVYDDSDLDNRVTDLEGLVGDTAIATQIANAIAALKLSETYEAKGAAAAVKTELLGSDTDTADSDTIAGAKKYANEKANAKVASVGATDNSIEIGGTATNPTVGVKVSPDTDNALQKTDNGMKVVIPDAAEISVVKKATANDGYIATYQVTVDGTVVGADINIPKDYLVKSADIKVVTTADDPYTGAAVGDKYIDFVVNTVDGDGNETHIYLSVQDLVDEYTAGDGIEISDSNVIKVKIDATNANGLSVDAAGLKMGVATDDAAGAMSAADHTKLSGISAGATKVESSETNGNVKIDGEETTVYTLPDTVVQDTDTIILDGGNA